jgi:hypothetical protein
MVLIANIMIYSRHCTGGRHESASKGHVQIEDLEVSTNVRRDEEQEVSSKD